MDTVDAAAERKADGKKEPLLMMWVVVEEKGMQELRLFDSKGWKEGRYLADVRQRAEETEVGTRRRS